MNNQIEKNVPDNKDFNVEMYRNENDVTKKFNSKILLGIIIVLSIIIVILIFIKARPCTITNQEEINKCNDQTKLLEEERIALAKDLYTTAKDIVGDIYLNTERICGPFIYEYNKKGEIISASFYKAGTSKFTSYQDFANYIRSRFSYELSNTLLNANTFKSVDGLLYCAKASRTANNRYIGLDSISLDTDQDNLLTFTLKEKYFAEGEDTACLSDCNYDYKENKFVLEYSNAHYLIKEFTLPY